MSRKKDREKAAKWTANRPVWLDFAAQVGELASIDATRSFLKTPTAQDTYARQLHNNLQHFLDSGFKRPSGAEPQEGRLYRTFVRNIASTLTPEQRTHAAAELSAWLGDT